MLHPNVLLQWFASGVAVGITGPCCRPEGKRIEGVGRMHMQVAKVGVAIGVGGGAHPDQFVADRVVFCGEAPPYEHGAIF